MTYTIHQAANTKESKSMETLVLNHTGQSALNAKFSEATLIANEIPLDVKAPIVFKDSVFIGGLENLRKHFFAGHQHDRYTSA